MSKGAEGARFLAAFGKLKAAVDDPGKLEATWKNDDQVVTLCDELTVLVQGFEEVEEWSPLAFTPHVPIAAAEARRDFDENWREVVSRIANRSFIALLDDLVFDLGINEGENASSTTEPPQFDALADKMSDWKFYAKQDAKAIKALVDEMSFLRSCDDADELDWVDVSLEAWDRLKASGLNIEGALWRRRAVPHMLIPPHVASYYGRSRASLYRRLHQAGKAFVFGAPLAALALQRAVIEEVLAKHWGAGKGWVRDANLPELSWEARAERLKRLANDALHGDPEKLSPNELDRSIIENFLLLRVLIEQSPEDLAKHVEARP